MNYNFTQNLIKSLRKNNTLIYLNLYNTALGDLQGTKIIFAFEKNEILEELDLGSNFLSIQFCQAFGHVLRNNYHLRKVNISKNQMVPKMHHLISILDKSLKIKYRVIGLFYYHISFIFILYQRRIYHLGLKEEFYLHPSGFQKEYCQQTEVLFHFL